MRRKILRSSSALLALVALCTGVTMGLVSPRASAVVGSDWRAGHIIDDSVFFNKDSMNVDQIQAFLDAKVPSCNRWRATTNPNYQPPYTCLKEYQENTTTHANNYGQFNSDGSPASVAGGQSAARIIWGAAQTYGINPQVLIVMLQKEQGLVTDDWPFSVQFQKAMGYACPDTAPCDEEYFGFFNQVDSAAWQLRQYGVNPGGYLYRASTTRFIGYNPNSSCDGTNVFIDNQATADLYNYTPYQPNATALNNLYGTGDGCSAYGNRNFWRYFNDWFGSTSAGDTQVQLVTDLTVSPGANALASDSIRVRFTLRNNTNVSVYAGGMTVSVRRASDNANMDYALRDVTIPAWGTYTYDESQVLPTGSYTFEIGNFRQGLGWNNVYPYSLFNTLVRRVTGYVVQPAVYVSSSLSLTGGTIVPGEPVTASFQVNNPSGTAVSVGTLAVTARDSQGHNVDFAADTNVTIPANSTYTYSKTRTFTATGMHTLTIGNFRPGIDWNATTPTSSGPSIVRSLTTTVKPNPRVVSSLELTPANPVVGENATATFQLRNDDSSPVEIGTLAVTARDSQGHNVDFAADTNVTIPANSTYTYSKTRTFTATGMHTLTIGNNYPSTGWRLFPSYESGTNGQMSTSVGVNPIITSSLTISPTSVVAGQNVTASFAATNNGDISINVGTLAVAGRDPQGRNVDFAPEANVTIPAHSTYTYTKTQTFSTSGSHKFSIANNVSPIGWNDFYPASGSVAIIRSRTLNVGANPLVTTGVSISPSSPAVGQNVTASFVVTNNGDVAMPVGTLAVAGRGPQGQNVDFAPNLNVSIPAHSAYAYSETRTFTETGSFTFSIANNQSPIGWNAALPPSASPAIIRSLTTTIKPNPRIITSLTLSPASPSVGQNVTASFQIRNDASSPINIGTMAVIGRNAQGANVDFAPDTNVTIPANTTYTYSQTRTFSTAGSHTFQIGNFRSDVGWNAVYPVSDGSDILRLLTVSIAN